MGGKRRRFATLFTAVTMVLGGLAVAGMASAQPNKDKPNQDQHCPDHRDNPKVDNPQPGEVRQVTVNGQQVYLHFSQDLKSVQFRNAAGAPVTVQYCIKAATDNSDRQTGDRGEVTWTNRGGQRPQISYVVVYGVNGQPPPPEGQATCRAVLLALFGEEFFVANPESDPCSDDDAGLIFTLADAIGLLGFEQCMPPGGGTQELCLEITEEGKVVLSGQGGGQGGSITVDLLYSRTRGDDNSGHAESGVADVSIASTAGEQLGVALATSEHSTQCPGPGDGEAHVVQLRAGGEEAVAIPPEHNTTTPEEIRDVLYVDLRRVEDDHAQAVYAEALGGNVSAGLARSESGCE